MILEASERATTLKRRLSDTGKALLPCRLASVTTNSVWPLYMLTWSPNKPSFRGPTISADLRNLLYSMGGTRSCAPTPNTVHTTTTTAWAAMRNPFMLSPKP